MTIIVIALVGIACASGLYAIAAHDSPPRIGYLGDFAACFICTSLIVGAGGALTMAAVRFVQMLLRAT